MHHRSRLRPTGFTIKGLEGGLKKGGKKCMGLEAKPINMSKIAKCNGRDFDWEILAKCYYMHVTLGNCKSSQKT